MIGRAKSVDEAVARIVWMIDSLPILALQVEEDREIDRLNDELFLLGGLWLCDREKGEGPESFKMLRTYGKEWRDRLKEIVKNAVGVGEA